MIDTKDLFTREAISIKNTSPLFQKNWNDLKKQQQQEQNLQKHKRVKLPYSYNEFCVLLTETANTLLRSKRLQHNFQIDQHNEPVIQQLFLYSSQNPLFQGNLELGIMLQGKYGCGKTLILEAFHLLVNRTIDVMNWQVPRLRFTRSIDLQQEVVQQGVKHFSQRPLIIDEFGRESKTIQNFGNVSRPLSELLSVRGDVGSLTHGTSNFNLETLSSSDFYGQMIGDRLSVMFNFITLAGNSRRK